jgi:hypothetical protein
MSFYVHYLLHDIRKIVYVGFRHFMSCMSLYVHKSEKKSDIIGHKSVILAFLFRRVTIMSNYARLCT